MPDPDFARELGARVRQRRHELGLTQRQLADACGATCGAVEFWERGAAAPGSRHLAGLCRALGVSADWLVFGERWDSWVI